MPNDRVVSVTGARVGAGRTMPDPPPPPAPPAPPLPPVPVPVPPDPPLPVPPPQTFAAVAELRGFTVPAVKFELLLSVSVQPAAARSAAVVFDSVGVGP